MFRPNRNSLKTVNPKGTQPKATPCSVDSAECIDLVLLEHLNKKAERQASHAHVLVDTGSMRKVRLSSWECSNGKTVFGVVAPFNQQGATASDVPSVDESTSLRCLERVITRRTRRLGETKPARTTTPGRVGLHPRTTSALRTKRMEIDVSAARLLRQSSTTRMATVRTRPWITSSLCVNAVISWSTTVRAICLLKSCSSCGSVTHAPKGSNRQVLVGRSAYAVGTHEGIVSAHRKVGLCTLNYGMGSTRLARMLKCSRSAAEDKIALYTGRYPAVGQFFEESKQEAMKTGYAFTVMGRRRSVMQIMSYRNNERSQGERLALNTPIQGSAADVVKLGQINIDRLRLDKHFGYYQEMQVHDEVNGECPKENAERVKAEIKDALEHPFFRDLAVYLAVDINHGESWMKAK